ncbi:hypothetical protein [Stappia sp. ES.058]|uniref:hypothetical protein n=1 Tax=Stappia sp. ES.058 TaxID=1881061 RepID=UPI00087D4F94|nr:hypothetical protein [Stappia sp. ES.058]SDT92092.1 hypothetical protein SAMN05428979_0412 [Stappia sp. ES.058]
MDKTVGMRRAGSVAAVVMALALAGCGSDGGGSVFGGGDVGKTIISGNASGKSAVDVDPDVFRKDVPCPSLEVEDNGYIIMKSLRGKDDDPRALQYQANLEKWARTCRREGGEVKMTLGVSGRVTPGPAWEGGEIFLPVRVTFVSNEAGDDTGRKRAKPTMLTVPVTLGAGAPAEQWALVEQNLVVPQTGSVKLEIALDDGRKRRQ